MKRILITRPRAQAEEFAEKLFSAGFEPIFFPVIEIQPIEHNMALERALAKLECYDWLVFTSANAVDVVTGHLHDRLMPQVAAIGPKTAQALQAHGITPDFVPEEYIAEAILPGLGDLRGKWVLMPRAEIAREALPEAICKAGGIPHEIAVYKTLPAQPDSEGIAALKAGVEVVALTSPSTVQNFVAIVQQNGLNPLSLPGRPLFACIGPITAQAAREAGLVNLVLAKEYTTEGLVEAISHLEVP